MLKNIWIELNINRIKPFIYKILTGQRRVEKRYILL